MNRRLLQSGTIVCSAIVLSGWAYSTSQNTSAADDEAPTTKTPKTPNQINGTEKHRVQKASLFTGFNLPDRLLNLQWGNRSSDQLPANMEAVYAKQLNQAQATADRENFVQAVTTVAAIPKNSQHYSMAQQLQEDWSQELLQRATDQWQQAQIKPAIAMINAIPPNSQSYDRALELRRRWKQQAAQFDRAIAAKRTGDWQGVINAISALEGSNIYNSLSIQNLLQEAMTKLYQPDQTFLQIATADLPVIQSAGVAAPETISLSGIR